MRGNSYFSVLERVHLNSLCYRGNRLYKENLLMGIGGGLGLKAFLTSEGRNNDISYWKRKKNIRLLHYHQYFRFLLKNYEEKT